MRNLLIYSVWFISFYLFFLCKYILFSVYVYIKYDDLYWYPDSWKETLAFTVPVFLGALFKKWLFGDPEKQKEQKKK